MSLTCSTVLPLNKDLDEDRLHPHHQCGSPDSPALFIFANLVAEPLSRPHLSSMSVSHLPWAPLFWVQGEQTWDGPAPMAHSQQGGAGGKKDVMKENYSIVCVYTIITEQNRTRQILNRFSKSLYTTKLTGVMLGKASPIQGFINISHFLSSGTVSLVSILEPMWNLF